MPVDNPIKETTVNDPVKGSGKVIEEVYIEYPTWKPVLQALEFDDGTGEWYRIFHHVERILPETQQFNLIYRKKWNDIHGNN